MAENLLSVEALGKRYGDRTLFWDLTFGLQRGEKVALVARNGSGKTTLIRMLMGLDAPDGGQVVWRNGLRVGYLDQNPTFPGAETALDALLSADDPVQNLLRRYDRVTRAAEDPTLADQHDDLQAVLDDMERLKAWDFEARLRAMCDRLGVPDLHQSPSTMSGGQRKRLALARVLLLEPEVMVLDEPTNHLDLDAIEWLESHLNKPERTLLLVTHDRYLLDAVCNRLWELDQGSFYTYQGNFSYYLEKKAERQELEANTLEKNRNLYRKELDWMRRQPKARSTKAKAREDRFEDLQASVRVEKRPEPLAFGLKMPHLGGNILSFKKVSKALGNRQLLKGFSYTFKRGERVGLVGPNGAGKSTMLRLIAGDLEPDGGGRVVLGETVRLGFYRQEGPPFPPEMRLLDYVKGFAEVIEMADGKELSAAAFLRRFHFPDHQHGLPLAKLSGGELRRVYLATVLMQNPNVLLLDEPTNDLDLLTLQALEDFLDGFQGVLIVVSHDRYLLDRVVDHLFILDGQGGVQDHNGSYTTWRLNVAQEAQAAKEAKEAKPAKPAPSQAAPKPAPKSADAPPPKGKLSYREQQEYADLEREIAVLEAHLDDLNARLNAGQGAFEELEQWSRDLQTAQAEYDAKSERWLELAVRVG